MSTEAVAALATRQAARRTRGTARRLLPWLVLLLLIIPMFVVILVAGVSSTMQSQGNIPTGDLSCTAGGAGVAGHVKATWNGRRFNPEQIANAQTIVAVGRQKKVPARGWVVALAAAMQESTLTNVQYGDRDSLGLFQMRPSMGWGTAQQLTNPVYAAGKFYDVLLSVTGWESMSITQAAQAVERSGFPGAYARHEAAAMGLVADPVILSASCAFVGGGAGGPVQQRVVAAAMSQLGLPYSWGGGGWTGPSRGIGVGANTVGFDCSGLTGYAWFQGSGGAVAMGTYTGDQLAATVPVEKSQIQAGDLLFFPGHVGLYDGRGGMIQAPHTGAFVEVTPNIMANSYWMGRLEKIGRPKAFLAMSGKGGPTARPVSAAGVAPNPAVDPRRRRADAA